MGKIVRHKERLVVKGCAQQYGIDYDKVFSAVVTLESIRILIAIATQVNSKIYHLDVKNAFLNGEIEKDIYITQSEGFLISGNEDHILQLQEALHKRFVRSKNDYTMYYETKVEGRLIIGVYVDDLIITRSNSHKIL